MFVKKKSLGHFFWFATKKRRFFWSFSAQVTLLQWIHSQFRSTFCRYHQVHHRGDQDLGVGRGSLRPRMIQGQKLVATDLTVLMGGIGYLDVSVSWFGWWMIRFHFLNSSWCCFKTWNSCHLVWHSWQQPGPFSREFPNPGDKWLQCNLRPSWRRWRPCRWLDHLQVSNLRWSHLQLLPCHQETRKTYPI